MHNAGLEDGLLLQSSCLSSHERKVADVACIREELQGSQPQIGAYAVRRLLERLYYRLCKVFELIVFLWLLRAWFKLSLLSRRSAVSTIESRASISKNCQWIQIVCLGRLSMWPCCRGRCCWLTLWLQSGAAHHLVYKWNPSSKTHTQGFWLSCSTSCEGTNLCHPQAPLPMTSNVTNRHRVRWRLAIQ